MRIIIIGTGIAGLWLCNRLSSVHDVTAIDKNDCIGKKLLMTGNGRCNLTNNSDINQFIDKCTGDTKALFSWLYNFGPYEIIDYFERNGVKLKEESEGRIFPVSDKAEDILKVLLKNRDHVNLIKKTKVEDIIIEETENGNKRAIGVVLQTGEKLYSDAVIVGTGGRSMPDTGSTGDGYEWFCRNGHSIEELYPMETSWVSNSELVACKKLQGISFNGSVKFMNKIYKGDFLITHYGFSGPVILDLGGLMYKNAPQIVEFNFSDMSKIELENYFERNPDLNLLKLIKEILPYKLIKEIMRENQPDDESILNRKWASIDKNRKNKILECITEYKVRINGVRGFKHAFVTGGGLRIKDFNPKTLESKYVDNLFAAGEILNVHGKLGGYNITISITEAEAIVRELTGA